MLDQFSSYTAVTASKDGRFMLTATRSGAIQIHNMSPLFEPPVLNPSSYSSWSRYESKNKRELSIKSKIR